MKSPSQALVWSAFSLSWPALLIQVAGVLSIVFLSNLAMDGDTDSLGLFKATELILIIGLVFLFSVMLHKSHNIARTRTSLGFPYRAEFSLPVPTHTLLLIPLLYFCALIQVAVFLPLMIVNFLFFNVEVSVLPISFMIFQFTALTLMLTWWTENGILSIVGWLAALVLFINGLLLPDFSRVENVWVYLVADPMGYAVSLFFTAALFALTYFGVKQQRRGETTIEIGNNMFNSAERGAIRDIVPLPIADCPISSPIAAEFWKERQLHGTHSALFGGLIGAATTIMILATINFFAGNGSVPKNAWFLALPMYATMCFGLTITMYGVRYKNGVPIVSLHDRTAPLSTAKLALIRTTVSLSSALLAGVIMFATLWIVGPFLVSNYQDMQTELLGNLTIFDGIGLADVTLIVFLSLVAFLTGLHLLVTFFTWTMLRNRAATIGATIIPIYIFLWSISLMAIYGNGDADAHNQAIDTVFANHLWILILLIPVALVIMLRDLLRESVITETHMLYILATGLVIVGLYLIWLFAGDHYAVLDRDLGVVQLGYLVMQSLLPLLAVVLALWTSNKIRHG